MNSDTILIKQFMQEHSKVAARKLEDLEPEQLTDFFNDSPVEWLLDVVPLMTPQSISGVFERMNKDRLALLFESMEIKLATFSLRMISEELADSILSRLSPGKSDSVRKLLYFLDHSVGAHMDPMVFTLTENLTLKEAFEAIKKDKQLIQPQIFVITSDRKLVGVISLSEIITGDPDSKIKSLMVTKLSTLSPETPIQSVLTHQDWQSLYALPVVDHTSLFLGVISLESIHAILVRSGDKIEDMGQLHLNALGELYRLGLEGLLRSATEISASTKE